MNVILLERIEKLGQMGDTVDVKPGYARNFLLPKKKAIRATKDNVAFFEGQRSVLEARNLEKKEEAQKASEKMVDVMVTVIRTASESGHLYGSVRSGDVASLLCNEGYNVSKNQVKIDKPVKELGIHEVFVALHPEVMVSVKLNVAQSQEEADVQSGKTPPVSEDDEGEEEEQSLVIESQSASS